MMNDDMHTMSSNNVDMLFDAMWNQSQRTQQAQQQATNVFEMLSNPNAGNEPRRPDGYYQQQQSFANNNMFAQQQPLPQQPQTYGFGYTEAMYGNGGMYNTTSMFNQFTQNQPQTGAGYYGFWNPGYGK